MVESIPAQTTHARTQGIYIGPRVEKQGMLGWIRGMDGMMNWRSLTLLVALPVWAAKPLPTLGPTRAIIEREGMQGVAQDKCGPGPSWQVGPQPLIRRQTVLWDEHCRSDHGRP